jgi:hypothetical protein
MQNIDKTIVLQAARASTIMREACMNIRSLSPREHTTELERNQRTDFTAAHGIQQAPKEPHGQRLD